MMQSVINQTALMWGLMAGYQSNYLGQEDASYFWKQNQHHGACLDGFLNGIYI